MPWDPTQYQKFQSQRSAPFFDLLSLIKLKEGIDVIDLGCGTGQLTRSLADRLPHSNVLGIDSSSSMLVQSAQFVRDGLRFEKRTIEEIETQWDIVFSNAAIQWVQHHEALIPKLWSIVKPGGQIAVQLPSNHNHISHKLILEVACSESYREALNDWVRVPPVLTIEDYARLLFQLGAEDINVFEKIYPHVLESADAIAEWTSGTALVPYFERLPQDLKDSFMADYRAKLKSAFPESPVFYPFRRIFFSAFKSAD